MFHLNLKFKFLIFFRIYVLLYFQRFFMKPFIKITQKCIYIA